jgi:hypothetical protein
MDGMLVRAYDLSTGGRGENTVSETIRLPGPLNTVAEIGLSGTNHFGADSTAFGVFTNCTTDGSNPGLPSVEEFKQGTLSGPPTHSLIRNGLTSITCSFDVRNISAKFIVNLFFWPNSLSRFP